MPLKLIYFPLYSPATVPLFSGPMQTYVVKLSTGATFAASTQNVFTLYRQLISAGVPVFQIIPASLYRA